MNSRLSITVDIDWACEAAIEETLLFLNDRKITPTVFITHRSAIIESCMDKIDVGLHPFFGENSSHGKSINEVVNTILDLPHTIKAFRSHRFGLCNLSKQAMHEAGMLISSNVCTDLETVNPFQDRFGFLELPIFLEDGGYLWQKHPLMLTASLKNKLEQPGNKIIIIHPMHFVVNTPRFEYMSEIKDKTTPQAWKHMTTQTLNALRFSSYGIRDFITDLIDYVPETITLQDIYQNELIRRNPLSAQHE